MEMITITPQLLKGTVEVPPSKSVAHRAIIAAALSGEACTLHHVAMSKDIEATLQCVRALGASFRVDEVKQTVTFDQRKSKKPKKELVLDCEESGSTLRFMIPVALLTGRPLVFRGRGRLMQRPQKPYFDLFDQNKIAYRQEKDSLYIDGQIQAGRFSLPGNVSSQFVSGLLFALPLLEGDSEIMITTPMESKAYLDLTLQVLRDFGIEVTHKNYRQFFIRGHQKYKARTYTVEADYSQAAFFLVADALGCEIGVRGLKKDSLQGDKEILPILKKVGAKVEEDADGAIYVRRTAQMRGIEIDAAEIPDLVPILAVLCTFLKGESRIVHAGRLRMKESDRLSAIADELNRLGADIKEGTDSLTIRGLQVLHGETVSSWNDHRIAMALSIAACRCEGDVRITEAETSVQKSYPDFYEVYGCLQKNQPSREEKKDEYLG